MIPTLTYNASQLDPAIAAAFDACFTPEFSVRSDGSSAPTLQAALRGEGSSFQWADGTLHLSGATIPQIFRAFTLWRGFAGAGEIPAQHHEESQFKSIGAMIDASRNAVPTVQTIKLLLRKMALVGMNQLMLYTEDTYEVPEQPFIGYMRGRYSQDELRELDTYAAVLGVEMIPCIQTLGHLSQMLRWPAFAGVKDTSDILLAEEPKTYTLLEQMLRAASAPYRSKRIHIGMDEAHDIGLGKYLQHHGFRPRFEILSAHLDQLDTLCTKLGLKPMIWSDMYFRLASKTGHYYSDDAVIPPAVAEKIPKNLQLVYWDYYHMSPDFYLEWFKRHEVTQRETLLAAGLWTWGTFWMNFGMARLASEMGLAAAKSSNVREVFTTVWGDDGNEVDLLSILPGLVHFAACAYQDKPTDESLRREFRASCDADWDQWLDNGRIDTPPHLPTIREHSDELAAGLDEKLATSNQFAWSGTNPCKALLWQDPLLGILDGNLGLDWGLEPYYRDLTKQFEQRVSIGWDRRAVPLLISRVLADKAELGLRIHAAYQANDRAAMRDICEVRLPRLLASFEELHQAHQKLWFEIYKPFGWEVLDNRYSAMKGRLRSTRARLTQWLNGELDRIEELELPRLPAMAWPKGRFGISGAARKLSTPSVIN